MSRASAPAPGVLFLLVVFLLVTTRWLNHEDSILRLRSPDAQAYTTIVDHAPALPPHGLPFAHIQRWIPLYILGLAAAPLDLPAETTLRLASIACILLTIGLVHRLLGSLGLAAEAHVLCLSMLVLHPYAFRRYLTVPGLLVDPLFVLGLTIALTGLMRNRPAHLLWGLLVAILSRQTALFCLPATVAWVTVGPGWRERPARQRMTLAVFVTSVLVGGAISTAVMARAFDGQSHGALSLVDLFRWLVQDFDAWVFAAYLARAAISVLVPLACLAGVYLGSREKLRLGLQEALCLGIAASLCLQPFLTGPRYTAESISRLDALAVVPLILALALRLRDTGVFDGLAPGRLAWFLGFLALDSLHPAFTLLEGLPGGSRSFAALQVCIALVVFGLTWRFSRSHRIPARPS